LGNGDGTFSDQAFYAGSCTPSQSLEFLAVGDVDRDSRLDVVAAGGGLSDDMIRRFLRAQPWDVRHDPRHSPGAPVETLRVDFPQPMDTASFSPAEDVVSFSGPGNALTVLDHTWINRSTLELRFAPQTTAGEYELVLGPDILDALGQPIDLDGDGGGEPEDDRYIARFRISQPHLVSHRHASGLTGPIETLRLTFDAAMDPDSFSPTEDIVSFSGPLGPITSTGHSWASPRALDIEFEPQRAAGQYTLVVGSDVADTGGNSLAASYTADFGIRGPKVTTHDPVGVQAGPIDSVQVTFDRPMDTDSFSLAEDLVGFHGPDGALTATGHDWLDDSQTLVITFEPQMIPGAYSLELGPGVFGTNGNPLDLDRDLIAGEAEDDRYTARFSIASIVSSDVEADTTWSGFVVVEGRVKVNQSVTLTIAPGTVVKFKSEDAVPGKLTVEGVLDVQGTDVAPVIFTSIHDDSVGGDTNHDGAAVMPFPDDWEELYLSYADGSSIQYAEIRYAGTGLRMLRVDSVTISHLTVRDCSREGIRISAIADDEVTLSDVTVRDCGRTGVEIQPSVGATVTLTDITVADAGADGIFVNTKNQVDGGGEVIIDGAHISGVGHGAVTGNNPGYALHIADAHNLANVSGLVIDGDSCRRGTAVRVGEQKMRGKLAERDVTLTSDLVWEIYGNIPFGVTVTVEPGTVIKAGSSLTVEGALVARGTAAAPIIYTSRSDDAAGGDTNADGRESHPRDRGAIVYGIRFVGVGADPSTLEHVEIRYAGVVSSSSSSTSVRSPLEFDDASPTLADVTVRHATYRAVDIHNGAAPTITDLTVDHCSVASTGLGGNAIYVREDADEFTIDGATIGRVDNWPVYLEDANHWDRVSGLEIDAHTNARGNSGYLAPSTLTQNASPVSEVAWHGGITVGEEAILTLKPGTIIKGMHVVVNGTLNAQGTRANPIVMTSHGDDTAAGDTNVDGDASVAAPGSGTQIVVNASGVANLDHVEMSYGPDATVRVIGGEATLTGCSIDGSQGIGVYNYFGDVTLTDCAVLHATGTPVEARGGAQTTLLGNLIVKDAQNADTVSVFDPNTTLTLAGNTLVGGRHGVNVED
jgi:hypothetical protein